MRSHVYRVLAVVVAAFLLLTHPVAAEAGRMITGKQIKNNTVTSADIKDRSLLAKDFKAGQLPSGATGPEGPAGADGQPGPAGPMGPAGIVHDESLDGTANPTNVPSSGLASGTITPGDTDSFKFYTTGTQPVRITLVSTAPGCFNSYDTHLEVRNASNVQVAVSDDVEGTFCSSLVFTPANGAAYTVRARGVFSSGAFDYVLKFDRGF